jgi:ABC-type multidrug transport system ATPase subunit
MESPGRASALPLRPLGDAPEDLLSGRTAFIIAHRLSTIADADEILVVRRGRIVERGDHAGLIGQGGEYAALWRRQTREEPAKPGREARAAEPAPVLISLLEDEPDPKPETEE